MQTAAEMIMSDLRRELPHLTELLSNQPRFDEDLAEAWERGATSFFSTHPVLSLLWSVPKTDRASALEAAVEAIRPHLSDTQARAFASRITRVTTDTFSGFRHAAAAIAELLVAGKFAHAGARVEFPCRTQDKTHDLVARRGGATVHVEVACFNISNDDERAESAICHEFRSWPRNAGEVPETLQGRVRQTRRPDGGFVRFCEHNVPPLGSGSVAAIIKRLAAKKNDSQLRGLGSDTLIVNSLWHEFGVSRNLALPAFEGATGNHTGIIFAASYGVRGVPILTGFHYDGKDEATEHIESDGILPRSDNLAAVGWLFHSGAPVVFERLDGAPHLSDAARTLVRDALVDVDDGFSRFRV